MLPSWHHFATGAVALAAWLVSSHAEAYCRNTTCVRECRRDAHGCKLEGRPLFWRASCVGLSLHPELAPGLDPASVRRALARAIEQWSQIDCGGEPSSLRLERLPDHCAGAAYDEARANANVVTFVAADWSPAESRHILARTVVTHDAESGEILGADIELNPSAELTTGDERVGYDLESVLTHELGHFIGLDHSADRSATMAPAYAKGSIEPRSIELDDRAGTCAAYPPGRTASCDPEPRRLAESCGDEGPGISCRLVAPAARPGAEAVAALLALGLLCRRRREVTGVPRSDGERVTPR